MSVTATAPIPATGQKVLEVARKHVGENYVLGVLVPKNNAGWTGAWDCAEFASWLIFQASATLSQTPSLAIGIEMPRAWAKSSPLSTQLGHRVRPYFGFHRLAPLDTS